MPELKDARIPLYQQLMEELKAGISSGRYGAGQKIPSEAELSEIYGVSRITVRRAVEELCRENYLSKYQGKGTFVNESKVARKIKQTGTMSFTDACRENGMEADAHVVSLKRSDARVDEQRFFGLAEGEQVFHLKRVRTANGTPIMLENTFFPCSFGDIDAEAFEHASLFDVIESATGHRITESPTTTLEIVKTTSEQANQLDIVTGEPLFYMHVYFTDAQGTPLVIGRQYIVGSRFIFSI